MALISISSDLLTAEISTIGAELKSVVSSKDNLQYIWNADPKFWNRSSPILFPIVGELKNNEYTYEGKNYNLPRHGFIRECEFNVLYKDANCAEFEFSYNKKTLDNYPFHFSLRVKYKILADKIFVTFIVFNQDSKVLLYSLGAHPGFMLQDDMSKYYIEFSDEESCERYFVKNGLIPDKSVPFRTQDRKLNLSKDLFHQDAIVLKKMISNSAKLSHSETRRGVQLAWCDKFSFFGIWSQKNCESFICLEPWAGIADNENCSGALKEKEGIRRLNPNETEEFDLEYTFF